MTQTQSLAYIAWMHLKAIQKEEIEPISHNSGVLTHYRSPKS